MWWGFSQALDLLDEYSEHCEDKKENGEGNEKTCNVLLIGQCDGRHTLKTIAQKYRHKENIKLKLYVFEPLLENVARQLLFTTLALEPPDHIGINDKTLFFMELYGNSLLRPATSKYLTKISKRLLNMVTNINYAEKILPSVSLDKLKYKERDQLEIIFKYWASNDKSFPMVKAWDDRLRKHLGVRYDSRIGVYDWDYHMRYHCYGADVLKIHEYKQFREKGISFYFEDTDPCVPNTTLTSAIFSAGSKILNYGYLGDIVTGPYVTFGFNCEDEDMFKKVNGQIRKTATDVTHRNLMRIFHEIEHRTPFIPLPESGDTSIMIFEDSVSRLKVMEPENESSQIKIKDAFDVYNSLSTDNVEIIFLPTTALHDYINKLEYNNFFDLVFVSQAMILKHIKPEVICMFKPNCTIIVDTPKFFLHYRKEDLEKFKNDVETLMSTCQCKLISSYNYETDEFARFKVNK